jgi:hypothetical protein
MLPAQRLGRILGALLGEGRPRTLRGAACRQTAGRRPTDTPKRRTADGRHPAYCTAYGGTYGALYGGWTRLWRCGTCRRRSCRTIGMDNRAPACKVSSNERCVFPDGN